MGLFGSKIEKTLSKIKKKEMKLEVRYQDGNMAHPGKIIRVDKDRFLMDGFAETLREDSLEVTCKEAGVRFVTRVTHKTHDIKGKLLYYCSYPDDLRPVGKREDRYFVYPRAVAVLSESTMEDLLVEREDVKVMKMYVWDITRQGLDLVNSKGYGFEPGHKFTQCKVQVGKLEAMCGMEVVAMSQKAYGKEMQKIIQCKFSSPPENLEDLIKTCIRIDAM